VSASISVQGVSGPSVRAVAMRVLLSFVGVWIADLELDPLLLAMAPTTGKVTITVGEPTPLFTMVGTVDPRGSGSFLDVATLRVLGGGAGWDKSAPRQDFQSDAGVLSSVVYSATATAVGEVVNVLTPRTLGTRYMRSPGPASRVLEREGETWWVDLAGVTQVGPRLPAAADDTLTLITWDPSMQLAELVCDALVLPGTVITDSRLSAPITVRDVEQRFDSHGSTVQAWCGQSSVAQFTNDLRAMVEQFSGKQYLKSYQYRIVSQNAADGRLILQAIDPVAGMPDTNPVTAWPGQSGDSAKYKPGSLVRLSFFEGDPTQAIVDSYQPGVLPLERTVDASVAVHVGPSAPLVDLAGGAAPVVPAPWATNLAVALSVLAGSLAGFTTGPLAPLGAIGTALQIALTNLPPAATTKTKAT
jgi:hypothetical protein